jgi:PAS domain S-box-containing protein
VSKGDPIPTRFDPEEDEALSVLQARTGLSKAEIVRRAVRLLAKRYRETGSASFIVEELGPPKALAESAESAYDTRRKIAIVVTDREGRIMEANAEFTKLCGYTMTQLRGKKPGELLQGEATEPEIVEQFREAMKAQRSLDCTITNYHASGAAYRVHVRMHPIFSPAGELVQFKALEEKVA